MSGVEGWWPTETPGTTKDLCGRVGRSRTSDVTRRESLVAGLTGGKNGGTQRRVSVGVSRERLGMIKFRVSIVRNK